MPSSVNHEIGRSDTMAPVLTASPYWWLKIGQTRRFREGDIAPAQKGWSKAEARHVWNDGIEADLLLACDPPDARCVLSVSGVPFIKDRQSHQRLSLVVNGHALGSWHLTDATIYFLSVIIEPPHWLRDAGHGLLKCVWAFPDSVMPAQLGAGPDCRLLGFSFQSIAIMTPRVTIDRSALP